MNRVALQSYSAIQAVARFFGSDLHMEDVAFPAMGKKIGTAGLVYRRHT